ncbi:MHC class II transactivator [Pseudonaja textilis]|uniref:MHC class II transactivator n=1 Tax=Pseudonaja textilis TaxID=8673 RepID=UPI000EA981DF|nr:MHC class II transactivator [Pseudonaja textilis]
MQRRSRERGCRAESLFWEVGAAEGPGGCAEAKTWGPSAEAPEAKRQRLAHQPALCIVSGDPLATPPRPGQDGTDSPGDFHVQVLVASVGPAGRSPEALGPSANGQLWCIPRHGSNIQMIFTFENAQQPCLPVDAPTCPGSVRAFCKRLKEHFRRECRPGPLYLEKDLVQHHLDGRGGRRAALRRCPLGEQGEASVERSRLFQGTRKPGLGSRTILVLGKAGTGKSHLVQKICLDWAEGRMPQFDLVLRFDCRRLSLLQGSCHDFRALLLDSLGGSCQGVDDVYHSLLQKPERLLLLFDGMEDLKEGPEGSSSASGSPAGRGAHRLGATLAPLFQRKGLSGCTFLLTGQRKGRLPPCFPRVDSVLEVVDFSPEQASLCLAGSFEGSSPWEQEANPVGSSPYLLSLCCNPGLCRFIGQAASETRGQELPSTLTGLFATYLLQKAAGCGCQALPALAEVSWSLGQRCQRALLSEQFPSADVKELALRTGLMTEQRGVCVFSNFAAQNFLVALHLTLAKEIKGKKLTKFLGLGAKFRKFLSSWGLVPRFLSGLLFLKDDLSSSLLLGKGGDLGDTENLIARKQRSLSRFIRKLPLRDFRPDKLLELLHCVHETEDQPLRKHLTLELRPDLSFVGFSLAPPDVSVLHAVLGTSPKKFSLDLRGTGIHLDGLRKLVGLKNVTKFRVSLREAVGLWKHLWGAQEREALQAALEKFLVEPFRAKTMGDVDALLALVQLQRDMAEGREDSAGSGVRLIPAVAGFLQLEFSLGPSCGLEGFRKLAGSLVAFSALQHLDLDSPDENEIGDEGVRSLTRVLPRLASLETLNLSRNKISDLGAELLAQALPSLRLLKTLSLYENNIGDAGAERVAKVLPQMCALQVLDLHCNQISAAGARCLTERLRRCPRIQSLALWNPTIPHGVLDHLQQLDSRIRRF